MTELKKKKQVRFKTPTTIFRHQTHERFTIPVTTVIRPRFFVNFSERTINKLLFNGTPAAAMG